VPRRLKADPVVGDFNHGAVGGELDAHANVPGVGVLEHVAERLPGQPIQLPFFSGANRRSPGNRTLS
jgi:hypothetical protein